MPYVWIRYRLPAEHAEYVAAMQGAAAKGCVGEIDQHCRGILKHGTPSQETARILEQIRDIIRDRPEVLID